MNWDLDRIKVLFICVRNSARSQIAEEFLRKLGGDGFSVESAGLDPGEIDPYVVKVMKEEGVDLTDKKTNDVWDLFKNERVYDYVITVCEKKWEEKCPTFPGIYKRENWEIPDPKGFQGEEEAKLDQYRKLKDIVKLRVELFLDEIEKSGSDVSTGPVSK